MYSDFFSINKNFQSSINLELDLNNEAKINEYIPTTDICDVLKHYIKSVLDINKERATTLVGPYGKGKSFLLLVLTYLLGDNKNTKCWSNLVAKIKNVDKELYDLLMKIKEEKINLLPVVINSNYDDIKQSFQIALNESLKRENLDDIIPDSVFSICLDLITKWENDESIKNDILTKCLELHNINLKTLKKELKNYSNSAYKKFETLYNCVIKGMPFNPLINNDIVKTYDNVLYQLNKNNYSGLFIVFDEFSKFLESGTATLMADLKIIQDFAELCARGNKQTQTNICCVTHKSVSLYVDKSKKDSSYNSFKTVEGRFKEIKFNRSLDENYQLIASAIIKKGVYESIVNDFINNNLDFYNEISNLNMFTNLGNINLLYKDCFPLNPITVFGLIQLSELVAQNERTLFTFLSDSDENSFKTFIKNYSDGLFNLDKVYDYFASLLQKEETNFIRNVWYRCESILSKLDDLTEKRVVKSIAIITMINDLDKLPCSDEIIALSLNLDKEYITQLISKLIVKHYLRRNILNNLLSFSLSNSKTIDETVQLLSKTKYKNLKYSEVINNINENKYLLPRRYNEENKITRFFKVLFMDENDFLNINSYNMFFEENYCDGIIVNLIRRTLSSKKINQKINAINDVRVIVKYPNQMIDDHMFDLAMRNVCLNEIIVRKDIDDITREEAEMLLEENIDDLKTLIFDYYEENFSFASLYNNISFSKLLSQVMDDIFTVRLKFNNELLNKRNVSTQYQKAVNHVIDYFLEKQEEFNFSETSPEGAVKYSVFDYNENDDNFRTLIEEIKERIKLSATKIEVKELISEYMLPPYGIRLGVLPLILAKAISELSDNIILYYQTKEITLSSNNLIKAVSEKNYYLKLSRSSKDQTEYLAKMKKLFNINSQDNFRKDVIVLAEGIRKYFLGLPNIIRSCKEKDNFLLLSTETIQYKTLFLGFNINPYESVFTSAKSIFNVNDYKSLYKLIVEILSELKNAIITFKNEMINEVKIIFSIHSDTSLKMGINEWITKNLNGKNYFVLSEKSKRIYENINHLIDYNDVDAINLISKAAINSFIEDWGTNNSELLIKTICDFMNEIKNAETIDENLVEMLNSSDVEELSAMGELLKNNVESALSEFSDSVSVEEKIQILKSLIKDLV